MKMLTRGLYVAALLALGSIANAQVVDSVNADKSPAGASWAASEVGWVYIPGFDYVLGGVETMFGSDDGRTVTVEIYDELPGDGGVLLRSAGFSPLANMFAGGSFAGLALTAGEDYFVGFRNVGGLSVNVTSDAGATSQGTLHYSFSNDGSYGISESGFFTENPILRFLGTRVADVPEPGSMALLFGMGTAGMMVMRRRSRK